MFRSGFRAGMVSGFGPAPGNEYPTRPPAPPLYLGTTLLNGLSCWYNSSNVNLSGSSSNVSSSIDLSGYKSNLIQNTVANQPLLVTNQINGYSAIQHVSANSQYLATSAAVVGGGAVSFIMVANLTSGTSQMLGTPSNNGYYYSLWFVNLYGPHFGLETGWAPSITLSAGWRVYGVILSGSSVYFAYTGATPGLPPTVSSAAGVTGGNASVLQVGYSSLDAVFGNMQWSELLYFGQAIPYQQMISLMAQMQSKYIL